jgi:hypothetical protein
VGGAGGHADLCCVALPSVHFVLFSQREAERMVLACARSSGRGILLLWRWTCFRYGCCTGGPRPPGRLAPRLRHVRGRRGARGGGPRGRPCRPAGSRPRN